MSAPNIEEWAIRQLGKTCAELTAVRKREEYLEQRLADTERLRSDLVEREIASDIRLEDMRNRWRRTKAHVTKARATARVI